MAWPAGLAAGLLAMGFAIALHQLARSNRPHELTASPYAAVLFAVSVGLSLRALVRLVAAWRDRRRRPLRPGHGVLAVAVVVLAGLGSLLFLAAASTAIDILVG